MFAPDNEIRLYLQAFNTMEKVLHNFDEPLILFPFAHLKKI